MGVALSLDGPSRLIGHPAPRRWSASARSAAGHATASSLMRWTARTPFRSYEDQVRKGVHEKVRRTVAGIAESAGAKAEVTIIEKYDPTINDEGLIQPMLPTLRWAANGDVVRSPLVGAAEDFSFFAKQAPGLFVFLGITPRDQDLAKAAPNHSPEFVVDELALIVGVRALAGLVVDFSRPDPIQRCRRRLGHLAPGRLVSDMQPCSAYHRHPAGRRPSRSNNRGSAPSFGHWRKRAGTRVKVGGCWRWPRSMMAAPGPKRLGSGASGCRRFGTGLCGSTLAARRA